MRLRKGAIFLYCLILVVFAFVSYSLVDPNLVLIDNQHYWQFQLMMWQNLFENPPVQAKVFTLLFLGMFISYGALLWSHSKHPFSRRDQFILVLLFASILMASHNALSHDIFNYIFNAKLLVEYGVNPNVVKPIEYQQDEMFRFLHNVHLESPYGYLWLIGSLIPYFLGFGSFFVTLFLFKLTAFISYLGVATIAYKIKSKYLLLVLANPMLLLETVSSAHNDVWMIFVAMLALHLIQTSKSTKRVILGFILLAASILIKLVTVVLVPLAVVLVLQNHVPKIRTVLKKFQLDTHWPLYASVGLFAPLLTSRSQYFHSWYLTWSFCWLVLLLPQNKLHRFWIMCMLFLSFGAVIRYVPWLYAGGYGDDVIFNQRLVTWLPVVLYLIYEAVRAAVVTRERN